MMDVKQKVGWLRQLRHLKGEVNQLSQRIALLNDQIEENGRSRWRGVTVVEHRARLAALRDRLALRRAQCMDQLGALYGFIDDIDDSRMRQIMVSRYIDNLSWREVAAVIGERDEQYPRRLHNRFLTLNELPEALCGAGDRPGDTCGLEGGKEYGRAN